MPRGQEVTDVYIVGHKPALLKALREATSDVLNKPIGQVSATIVALPVNSGGELVLHFGDAEAPGETDDLTLHADVMSR